jgi:pimeloyl-ACP methyl ester carboxylesterase
LGETSLYYETRGSGPPLVLLNGLSQSTLNWMTQARRLAAEFTVITYDARGQGRTPAGAEPLSLAVQTRDLARLLDHLELPTAHLVGFSYGARLALGFAARRPQRVRRLVLTSTGLGESALRRTIVRSWVEVLKTGGLEAMIWAAVPHIFGEQFLAKHENSLGAIIRAGTARNSAEGLTALIEGYMTFGNTGDDATRVLAPTLIISAEEDPLVPLSSASTLVDAIPNAEHLLIQASGHTIPIEHPEAWRSAVQSFLSRVQ